MASITYASPYLAQLKASASDSATLTAMIAAADKAVSRYLRRNLELTEYDRVFLMKGQSTIFLDAYPISVINRIMIQKVAAFTVSSTATVATFGTSSTGIVLSAIVAGVRTDTTLLFATYPSITALVSAINGVSGFSAIVQSWFGSYPSADILAGVSATANGNPVLIWVGNVNEYQADNQRGYIHIYGSNLWLATGVEPSAAGGGDVSGGIQNDSFVSDLYRGVRVVWTGGYATVPEDIQYVVGQLVMNMFNGNHGRINSENIGGYSYSASDVNLNALPITSRKMLDSYRVRLM